MEATGVRRWTALVVLSASLYAQTTDGLIAGRVVDSISGAAVDSAEIAYLGAATNSRGIARPQAGGYYAIPSLPPGLYRIRVTAANYQAQEAFELDLPVAGRLEVNFRMRPLSDVWEAGQSGSVFLPGARSLVTFFGPDVDTSRTSYVAAPPSSRGALEASISQVIDPVEIRELPLAGRDVYTALVTQAGAAADTSTARGLGLAVNGQRPSASNFLLDGAENNNYLVTGPLTTVAPEAVQEYRVSTNNYSAEYGSASGYVANAVSRSGGNAWRGLAYFYGKHSSLNANGFQPNRLGVARPPGQERQPGGSVGGPLRRDRLFVASSVEWLDSRASGSPVDITLPSKLFLGFPLRDSIATKLLTQYTPPVIAGDRLFTNTVTMRPPSNFDRLVMLHRGDWVARGGRDRIGARLAVARLNRPEFIWSPYRDFISGLEQRNASFVASARNAISPALTNEALVARNTDTLQWDRAHPEIPTLQTGDGVALPGSPAMYAYRNRNRSWQARDNISWTRGRHIARFGASLLVRNLDGYLTAGRDARYIFDTIVDFALDSPSQFQVPIDRAARPARQLPDFNRQYRQTQSAFFAQDAFRVTPRFVLNLGMRYESFGAPVNHGPVKDFLVGQPAPSGDQRMYAADRNDWAARIGFSYALSGGAVLRGAYGIFYDRPFDNSWLNLRTNQILLPAFQTTAFNTDYLEPVSAALRRYQRSPMAVDFPSLTRFQDGIRTPYAQAYFASLQQGVTSAWTLELAGTGSLGRKLITTDLINRGIADQELQNMSYRANQGSSSYHALTAVARYRSGGRRLHAAYTWSHAIDNQSEPLAGEFFDLSITRGGANRGPGFAAFSRQGDSRGDRGNADFDQRHNLVVYSVWELPSPSPRALRTIAGGWRVAQLAAFRSGFSYTVFGTLGQTGRDIILNNRANLRDGANPAVRTTVAGGERLLDRAAFFATSTRGNTARNAFRGPGFYNVDLSLAKGFALPWFGESGRVTFRADAFNFLNHANLNNPSSVLGAPDFGVALRGRSGRESGFPAQTAVNESARQVQLMLRIEF